MRFALYIVTAVLLAQAARAEPVADDIFLAKPSDAVAARLVNARFGVPGAEDALRAALAAKTGSAASIAAGWAFLCKRDYGRGDYPRDVADCRAAMVADPSKPDDRTILPRALGTTPAITVHGSARVAVGAGDTVPVRIGRVRTTAIVDTGAEIAVMMDSVARGAGVRFLGDSGKVDTTTAGVNGRSGIIPRVVIGGAAITNIPVLVLPDAALTFDDSKFKLPFVLSLYAVAPFGRIAWLDHGKVLALGAAAPQAADASVPVFWHPLGIGIALDGPGGRRAAHLDTGSDTTYLFERSLDLVSEAERAAATQGTRRIGGVGGVVTQNVRKLPTATLTLDGQPLVLTDVDVDTQSTSGEAARIGGDIFKRYGTAVLDFGRMRFSLQP